MQCLQSLPSRTPAAAAPGARTRFDDFVALHINQTMFIHYSATFLSWHRYYLWTYEQALVHECGFTGAQPVRFPPLPVSPSLLTAKQYWDWPLTTLANMT